MSSRVEMQVSTDLRGRHFERGRHLTFAVAEMDEALLSLDQ
jgi:hypothetical protein